MLEGLGQSNEDGANTGLECVQGSDNIWWQVWQEFLHVVDEYVNGVLQTEDSLLKIFWNILLSQHFAEGGQNAAEGVAEVDWASKGTRHVWDLGVDLLDQEDGN